MVPKYATNKDITNLLKTLERETNILLDWFTINEMEPNVDKCHLLVGKSKGNDISQIRW